MGRGGNPVAHVCSKNFPKKITEAGFTIPNEIKCKATRNTKICCPRAL